MRPNNKQNQQRMRGRNNNPGGGSGGGGGGGGGGGRKGPNPLSRTYESNGPDVKVRGTAHHVAEKYVSLARDAQSSGDIVLAENYLQHAEHYYRLIAAAQAAMQQPINIVRSDLPQDDEDEGDDLDTSGDRAPQPVVAFEPTQPYTQPYVEDPASTDQPDLPPRGERPPQNRFDRRGPPPNGNGNNPYRRNERGERPRFDRPEGERPYRDERGEPMGERPQRDDRGERMPRDDRGERVAPREDRGERMPRDDRGERRFRDRFDRGDRGGDRGERMPREERAEGFEGAERQPPVEGAERPVERGERPIERGERPERPRRPERYRSRGDAPRMDAPDSDQPSLDALPAFITGGAPRVSEPARVEPVRAEPPREEAPRVELVIEAEVPSTAEADAGDETPRRRVRGGRGRGRKADADVADTAAAEPSE